MWKLWALVASLSVKKGVVRFTMVNTRELPGHGWPAQQVMIQWWRLRRLQTPRPQLQIVTTPLDSPYQPEKCRSSALTIFKSVKTLLTLLPLLPGVTCRACLTWRVRCWAKYEQNFKTGSVCHCFCAFFTLWPVWCKIPSLWRTSRFLPSPLRRNRKCIVSMLQWNLEILRLLSVL